MICCLIDNGRPYVNIPGCFSHHKMSVWVAISATSCTLEPIARMTLNVEISMQASRNV